MKILVAYGSHLGSTAAIAERIGEVLRDAGATVSVQPAANAGPVDDYDAFVVGGGTYGGRWHPDAVAFLRRDAERLAARPVWLFSSGPLGSSSGPLGSNGRTEVREPVEMAELAPLVRARAHVVFAGAHDHRTVEDSELGRVERFIAKRFVPEGDWRDWSSIEAWARAIAMELKTTAIGAT